MKRIVARPAILGSLLAGSLCFFIHSSYTSTSADPLLGPDRPVESSSPRAPRGEGEQMIIDAYKRANKSVVNVNTKAEAFDLFGPVQQEGSGSGVIIDAKRALVLTNFHVVTGAQRITLTLVNGQSYGVRVIGQDPDNDLALLQINEGPNDLVQADLGDSSSLEVGQRVLAIGNPFGLNRTLTDGIVSSLGRSIRSETGVLIQDIIQTDAAINPGNSGGPLLDTAGRVVGINSAIVSRTGENAGIGFAVPVNQVKTALPQLIKYGKVLRPNIAAVITNTDYGPMFLQVQEGGPADQAGLSGARQAVSRGLFRGYTMDFSQADFILGANGRRVENKDEVLDEINSLKPDQDLELLVKRGNGKARKVSVRPVLS